MEALHGRANMTKERALIWLVGVIALLVAIMLAVKAWDSFTARLDKRGYDRGVAETESRVKTRDNQQLLLAITKQKAAEVRAGEAEAEAAKSQLAAETSYRKGVKDGEAKTAARVAAVRAGDRLRDPGADACAPARPGSGEAQSADAKPGSNDKAGGQLSGAATEFLLTLTGEADAVTRQLTLAQSEITTIVELCAKR